MRLSTLFLLAAVTISLPSFLIAQFDIRIGCAASNGGAWSGGNPDIWTGDGAANPDRTVNKDEIINRLNAGTSVTIVTAYGSITDSAGIALLKTSGGDAVLLLKASAADANSSNITFSRNDTIASTSGRLTIIINSDGDGSGDGCIATEAAINTECYFASNGGDIILGGGADPLLTPAYGSTAAAGGTPGISLQGMTMIAGTGSISLRGNGTKSQTGTALGNSTLAQTTSGSIGMYGTGGSDAVGGIGLSLSENNTTIQTEDGSITLSGTGGLGTSLSGTGLLMSGASRIISVNGNMNITGKGSDGIGAGAHGVWIGGGGNSGQIQTVNGTITIHAIAGSSSTTSVAHSMNGMGIVSGEILATGTGSIDITATGGSGVFQKDCYGLYIAYDVGRQADIQTNTGNISIRAIAGAGGTGGSSGLFMSQTDYWAPGPFISSTSGNITVHGTSANGGHGVYVEGRTTYIQSGGDVTVTGDASGSGNPGNGIYLRYRAYCKTTGAGDLTLNGTGAAGSGDCSGVNLSIVSSVETESGSLTINATGGGSSGTGGHGMELSDATIYSRSGRVVIGAIAGYAGYGIFQDVDGTIRSDSGNVLITAIAKGTGSVLPGIYLISSSRNGMVGSVYGDTCMISATGSGTGAALSAYYLTIGSSSFAGELILEGGGTASDLIDLRTCPIRGKGGLTIRPVQAGTTIGIAGGTGSLNLSTADLGNVQDGFRTITIGRSDGTGTMTVNASTFTDGLTLKTGSGPIAINGALSVGTNSLTIMSDGNVSQAAAITAAQLTVGGTGEFNLVTQNNTIGTLFADAAIVRLRDDAGIVVGRLNATEAALSTQSAFTETAEFSVSRLSLAGSAAYSLSDTLQKLTLGGTASLILTGATAVDTLIMSSGTINTGAYTFSLGTGSSSRTSLVRTAGTIIGTFKQWVDAATVSSVVMPVGIAANYRGADITFTSAPATSGSITAQFIASAPGTSGLQATDADGNVVQTLSSNGYWRLMAGDGLSGGTYDLDLHADGFSDITNYPKVKIMKRPDSGSPWAFAGAHAAGTLSSGQPIAHRTGLSGFGEYGVGPSDVPTPAFSAERSSIDMGGTLVNTARIDSIEIKNTGTAALTITSLTSNNTAYTFTQGDTVIAIGDSVTYYLIFTPPAIGTVTGSLNFYHNAAASPFSVALTGRGIVAEPTVAASALTFTSVGTHSFTVNWTNGNGSNRVVLACAGSSISALPADGTAYSANARFGSGSQVGSGTYVVYSGSGASVTVSGLLSGATYAVEVIENNGSAGTINYLTSSPPTGSQTTAVTVFDSTAGHAMQFHGGSDAVTVPAAGLPAEYGTVEAWVKIPASGAGSGLRSLISKFNDYGLYLMDNQLIAYDWFMEMFMGSEWDASMAAVPTGQYLNDDLWHHAAMTFVKDISGNLTLSIFIDGAVTPVNNYGAIFMGGYGAVKIGAGDNLWSPGSLNGQIDEVKIWNTVRTIDQIRSDMHRTPTGDPSGLVAVYQFTEESGATVGDVQGGYHGSIAGSPSWIVSTAPVGKGVSASTADFVSGTAALGTASMNTTDGFDAGVNVVSTAIAVSPSSLPAGPSSILNDRYWIINAYGSPGTYSANMTFTVPSDFTNGGSADASHYTLYRRGRTEDGPWTAVGTGASLTETSVTFNGVTSLGQFAIGTSEVLPVELASFTASAENSNALLVWNTASELNNYGFDVERRKTEGPNASLEGAKAQWQKVGFVSGSGTNSVPKSYRYTDKNIPAGSYAYRLKQIDTDGKFSYSQSIHVTIAAPKQCALMQNYPNPFNPETVIGYQVAAAVHVNLTVYDVLGRKINVLVDEMRPAGSYEARFDASAYSAGIYFVRISAGSFSALKKMMLLK